MRTVTRLVLCLLLLPTLGACVFVTAPPERGSPRETSATDPTWPDATFMLWQACTPKEAAKLAMEASESGPDGIRAASCYATLAETGQEKGKGLSYAISGLNVAEQMVAKYPDSGLAHYLAAYLAGLKAERDPSQGLKLVPVIEREASIAARLTPMVDGAGPDRMLGELYLRAPGFPLSIGDTKKAVEHYRKAYELAPEVSANRLGLIDALIMYGESAEACTRLRGYLIEMESPECKNNPDRMKIFSLMQQLCDDL